MRTSIASAALAFALFLPATAMAQGALTLGGAYDLEYDDGTPGLTVGGVFHTGGVVDHSRLSIDARYWLVDTPDTVDFMFLTFNIDGQYLIGKGNPTLGYGLIGLNVGYSSIEVGGVSDTNTDLGLNLGLGGEFDMGPASLYGEGKFILGLSEFYEDRIVVSAGIRLYFGGGGGGDLNLSDF